MFRILVSGTSVLLFTLCAALPLHAADMEKTLRYKLSVHGIPFFDACGGRVLVHITFPAGVTPRLAPGAAYRPTGPLTIQSVTHSADDPFVYVEARIRGTH